MGTMAPSPSRLRALAVESAWTAAHAALYPFGLLRERTQAVVTSRLDGLRPRQRSLLERNVEAAGTPVVLLHGMVDNRTVFRLLARRLRADGFRHVLTLGYSLATNDVRSAAQRLGADLEALAERTGCERVVVVGHSLGGLIARYYVQQLGGDARVATLVTLGAPHHGTRAANWFPTRLPRQLRPGSPLFAELDAPAPGCRTRFVTYWSDGDQVILPQESGALRHPDLDVVAVAVHDVGHMSLPIDRRIADDLSARLASPAGDGNGRERSVPA